MIRPMTLTLILILSMTACGSGEETPPPVEEVQPATSIEAADLLQRIHNDSAPIILDVRSEEEYQAGHVPAAQLIPHDELANRLLELAAFRHEELVVYCQSGRRAGIAETILKEAGFTHIVHLNGDWANWSAAGHPTSTNVTP